MSTVKEAVPTPRDRALELFLDAMSAGPWSLAYEPSYEEILAPVEPPDDLPDLDDALELRALAL